MGQPFPDSQSHRPPALPLLPPSTTTSNCVSRCSNAGPYRKSISIPQQTSFDECIREHDDETASGLSMSSSASRAFQTDSGRRQRVGSDDDVLTYCVADPNGFRCHGPCAARRQSWRPPTTASGFVAVASRPQSVSAVTSQPRWLGRTPSWPSALIRVKERILEKVSESSVGQLYCFGFTWSVQIDRLFRRLGAFVE